MSELAGGMAAAASAEIAKNVTETATNAAAESIQTASQGLASTLEGMGSTQGAGAALSSLAETGAGEIPDQGLAEVSGMLQPDLGGASEAPDNLSALNQTESADRTLDSVEADAVPASTEVEEGVQAEEPGTTEPGSDNPNATEDESGNADEAAEDSVATQEIQEQAETAQNIETQAEALSVEVNNLTAEMKAFQEQFQAKQEEILGQITEAMSKIDGLEDTLKQAIEEAPPEQKKQLSLLLMLLQALVGALGVDTSAVNGKSSPGERQPTPIGSKPKAATPPPVVPAPAAALKPAA